MESPPSSSTWSEAFMLSDDSGLLLTSGSVSSGSMSDSLGYRAPFELQDSDYEVRSLSRIDSLDGMSDIMCGENFNTLKKGPHWNDLPLKYSLPIDPPEEFQDKPMMSEELLQKFAERLVFNIVTDAIKEFRETELTHRKLASLNVCVHKPVYHLLTRTYWTQDFLPFSPCHTGRPSSRSSLGSSRLSSSHNSLTVPSARRVDDSNFITQAVSHDTLSSSQISDFYNVPFDSDVYSVPVDVIKPQSQVKYIQPAKKKRRSTTSGCREWGTHCHRLISCKKSAAKPDWVIYKESGTKRHSVAGSSTPDVEPIHMTLQEVRHSLENLYSSSSDSLDYKDKLKRKAKEPSLSTNNNRYPSEINVVTAATDNNLKTKRNQFFSNTKNKKCGEPRDNSSKRQIINNSKVKQKKFPTKLYSLKQSLCNIFRLGRLISPERTKINKNSNNYGGSVGLSAEANNTVTNRALPPLPSRAIKAESLEEQALDFSTSIKKVKDYGWYWGPLSSEAAEKILSNEPDGSFIVRDSSDDHYIFSLTFKLNECIRHVRIEHDQGNFSFGYCTKFKSQTIVEFIENAVEHSRTGRYLFFFHRRPTVGPVRVQLLHPVSRFKHVQSLQHMCRFVILKVVRRDLIPNLPLPRRMIDYLNNRHYYSEHLIDVEESLEEPARVEITENNVPDETEHNENVVVPNNYILVQNQLAASTNPTPILNTGQS